MDKLHRIKDIALNSEKEASEAADGHCDQFPNMTDTERRLAKANFMIGWICKDFEQIVKIIEE